MDQHPRVAAHGLELRVDPRSGLPASLAVDGAGPVARLRTTLVLDVGGREERTPFGGLVYPGTRELHGTCTGWDAGVDSLTVRLHAGEADVVVEYALRPASPRLRVRLAIAPRDGAELVVRDVRLTLDVETPPRTVLAAPGNRVRPGLRLHELDAPLALNGPGGTAGSAGLLALSDPEAPSTLVMWPLSRDALGTTEVRSSELGCELRVDTRLAGVARGDRPLTYGDLYLDVLPAAWDAVRPGVAEWFGRVGVVLPDDQPAWTGSAAIFEAQLGTSLFGTGFRYAPYPEASDLLADLPRIAALGFDTIQVMPRQPFPSYAVLDLFDIGATYGDPDVLRELVHEAHDRGMRVILDVLMHGVVDREIVRLAADAVRAGPHGAFLAAHPSYRLEDAADLPFPGQVPWSQHILDFEAAWLEGAPEVHPLTREHPEWFYRDSDGAITSVYTKAIDISHPGWQEHLLAALRHLVADLGVDGFRFDAPTYNGFANWSERTRTTASRASLGALGLFRWLRGELRPDHPELMFYTEPSGVFLRESMDVSYNYDEHAQIEDLMGYRGAALGADGVSTIGVRHARDLAAWWEERDAVLPARAVTAHHIDSHDTFWWPRPGSKWRREQVGVPATRALVSIFALSGGPYMTFVGGELGIEDHLSGVLALRRRPEFRCGVRDSSSVSCEHDDVYAVVRRTATAAALVLVNASPTALHDARVRLDGVVVDGTHDLLTGERVEVRSAADWIGVDLPPYGTRVLSVRQSCRVSRD